MKLNLNLCVRAALLGAALLLSVAHASERIYVDAGDSPTIGPANAPVTMVEFVDYS